MTTGLLSRPPAERLRDHETLIRQLQGRWRFGTGTPEGVVAAPVGTAYLRDDGGAGSTMYVKETGSSTSTGWVAK